MVAIRLLDTNITFPRASTTNPAGGLGRGDGWLLFDRFCNVAGLELGKTSTVAFSRLPLPLPSSSLTFLFVLISSSGEFFLFLTGPLEAQMGIRILGWLVKDLVEMELNLEEGNDGNEQ